MLRNYLAAALRNLVRNRLYTAINVIGLAGGFAAVILIATFVRDELSFDTWIPGHENVFRVATTFTFPGGQPIKSNGSGGGEGLLFKQDFPEIIAMARLEPQQRGLRHGDIEANETIISADPEIFEVFPFPVYEGDLRSALSEPETAVVTRKLARKYFGRDNVIGQTLEIDRTIPIRISAVLEDLPTRSHLDIGIIVSGRSSRSPLMRVSSRGFSMPSTPTYVRLAPGALQSVKDALPDFIDRHHDPVPQGKDKHVPMSTALVYELQPISKIHMMPMHDRLDNFSRPSGDPSVVLALAMTGVLILFVAVGNFTNLMTARAGRRCIEVGVRKVTGAQRRQLIFQFVGESLVYVVLSFAAAVALAYVLLPSFNAFLGRTMTLLDPTVLMAGVALVLITGVLGGAYPALVLSAFRPASALKGHADTNLTSGLIRQSLVIAQFAVLIGMIAATLVIGRQTTFALRSAFQSDDDQLLIIAGRCQDALKNTISGLPGVRGVACAESGLFDGLSSSRVSLETLPDGSKIELHHFAVEPGALELLGLKPVAGRFPQPGGSPKILNEAALRLYRFASAEAAIGAKAADGEIVAVVPDLPLRSVRQKAIAAVFVPGSTNQIVVKLDGSRIGETLPAIDAAWKQVQPNTPIRRVFYDQKMQARYLDLTRQTQAFMALSVTAVLIACLGLFGLAAFAAEQRTKEIGIRKAMGATRRDILGLLLWQFTKPVLWANLIAWPVAGYLMQRWLEGFAYHVDLEAWMFLAASGAAIAIAVLTVIGHALLVARAKPVAALRYE